ncbi:MAG: cytochrome c biogenesis protein CcdA [Bacteroidales bacterium]|nr:thioredoxin family protein [Bacteroidales bacterium]MDD2204335.1 cytochrome c biogenesis protein CcdA [Bacteroidales bacterium]MDD3152080.1 cytochrome c biogenesis protein CcdA [Bacteroidales bacterium]MDD3913216.1 cytochrome c biogenesis protein CcdA [Bacteroidales bacterium]MDD4633131.1 cytochrome c biogenesis protein CcdA [Bacteroidales bacterium]
MKLKNLLFSVVALLLFCSSYAQIHEPVKWSFNKEKISDSEYNLIFKASIDEGWHLYSQFIEDGGPIPTSFSFTESPDYQLIETTIEPKSEEEWDPNFEMTLKYFSGEVTFVQAIKVLNSEALTVEGSLEFMACDNSQCLPPEIQEFKINVIGGEIVEELTEYASTDVTTTSGEDGEKQSLWKIFLLGIVGGLIALVTPCVWPMIPMTVSFFLKSSGDKKKGIKKAVYYGISIIIIYVALGLGITLIFGADALNALATNPWFNVAFFVLLVVFAASFLGAFELTLPSKWVNKMDAKSETSKGFFGVFFMAFTLVLVSFSCTGPIIGTLLVEAVVNGVMAPLVGMTGFALALAIPFTLFAIFPSWLSSMPKSGGWMNSVKVVLGFLELALGLKFLSVADLTMHWGILDRETFLVLWIVIFAMLGFYLLGKLKLPHDSDLPHVSVGRLFMALISFAFAIYMIPGLWGAPLKAISAFAPPMYTQDFNMIEVVRNNSGGKAESICAEKPKYSDFLHIPDGLEGYFDYDEALECARAMNKPLFIDFTGHGCVNCRNMEAAVWIDPQVRKLLEEEYIIVELYVDDKTPLEPNEVTTVEFAGKTKHIKTIGNKWSYYQAAKFGSNSQPYYVLMDTDEQLLTEPHVYDLDPEHFIDFLSKGVEEFKKR